MLLQTALQIRSFIRMNDILLGKFVKCAKRGEQNLLSLCFVAGFANVFDDRTSRFVLVAIAFVLRVVCSDSLYCRFVVCHRFLKRTAKIRSFGQCSNSFSKKT